MKKKEPGDAAKGRKQVTVVNSRGRRSRFLRGMITHDLVQRGLDFERAYSVASSIRDKVTGEEVTTTDLSEMVASEFQEQLGREVPPLPKRIQRPAPTVQVLYHGERQPFSRGLLARSIHAAGPDLDEAYRLVGALLSRLDAENITELRSDELVRRVSKLLEAEEDAETARRYLLVRRTNRLPRPLVLYMGGATGTGKSTLSLETAPLLRIYRIGSTDTIRQVMRIVFSKMMLPALHSSSFEPVARYGEGLGEDYLSGEGQGDYSERLLATFEEQAARVVVGVRAVVERAIAENMSVVVEGVHVYPPLVPFPDLEGAVYQVPLMLGTLDEEVHRQRFLTRASATGRHAERYLESFASIRQIHDFLLQQAEAHDVQLIDTSEGEPPVVETLRLVTELVGSKLPDLYVPADSVRMPPPPTLLLIIDGMTDRPVRSLGGRTPLRAAKSPTLDRLAAEGQSGLADPVAPGVVADTAAGTLALFGQSPVAMSRGPVEALGAGIELRASDVAIRGNLGTIDEHGTVVDRRAGRIREGSEDLAAALDRLPLSDDLGHRVEVRVRGATEHRLAIVLRGKGLSSAIDGSDPGQGALPCPPLTPTPRDPKDSAAVLTARALALFEQKARRVLARHKVNKRRRERGEPVANSVLTRGAGRVHRLVHLEESGIPLRICCVAGDRTVLGLAGWLGARTIRRAGMTGSLDTDLELKFRVVREALSDSDLAILHVKGADIAAHDQRPELKVDFLERVDKQLSKLIESYEGPLRIAVASDHATLSESGQHAADALPVLIWGDGIEADEVTTFDESSAAAGALQRFPLQMFLTRLYELRRG
jgi:2,3-bisphosphoglycerate-independent phosphoglycerate mutase